MNRRASVRRERGLAPVWRLRDAPGATVDSPLAESAASAAVAGDLERGQRGVHVLLVGGALPGAVDGLLPELDQADALAQIFCDMLGAGRADMAGTVG